jgi:hypothetical protein
MFRTVVACVYMGVWGIATVIILFKNGTVPPEYWTLPAVGLGGLFAALNALSNRKNGEEKKPPPPHPPNDDTLKENV